MFFQKKELTRQRKAIQKRADQIHTKGFFHKGRWIRPEVKEALIVKPEEGAEVMEGLPIKFREDEPLGQRANHNSITRDAVDTVRSMPMPIAD
jgi:hypothetical protein